MALESQQSGDYIGDWESSIEPNTSNICPTCREVCLLCDVCDIKNYANHLMVGTYFV